MADQQYCLRWNNHQPTLAGSFDRMLKDDRFTDCTLSAEGVNIEAHRMLLCACSPYFDALFKQYKKEQFPIVIIRDVSLVELKALMDYMYRGEVNISQDQLAGLLKVAELLQIKGLYEAGFSETRTPAPTQPAPRVSTGAAVARPQPLDLPPDITSDGAASPAPKRRKRARRRSSNEDFPSTIDVAAEPVGQAVAPPTLKPEPVNNNLSDSVLPVPPKLEENQFDVVLPKEEYIDDQDSIENITLDDDDMDEMDQAGPSHGDGSSQGYPPSWHQSDRSTEDLFLTAQDSINNAGGAQRDSQGTTSTEEIILQCPEQVFLKEELLDQTFSANLEVNPLDTTILGEVSRLETNHDEVSQSAAAAIAKVAQAENMRHRVLSPRVCLERIDAFLRSSPRLSARNHSRFLQRRLRSRGTSQPDAETRTVSPQPPPLRRINRSSAKPSAQHSDCTAPGVSQPHQISAPPSLRRYQLILPKPTPPSSSTQIVRRRKLAARRRTSRPLYTCVKKIIKKPVPIQYQCPSLAPLPSLPPLTMSLAAPPVSILQHFLSASVPATSTPNNPGVKWPLPPKQAASSMSSIMLASEMLPPPGMVAFPSNYGPGAVASNMILNTLTPNRLATNTETMARRATNGYQCCFCNELVGTMAELMTHLRTCSALAAAKM